MDIYFKSTRKNASKWNRVSERALLEVWGDKMGELRGCRKNRHIILEMVEELAAQGHKYTVVEIKTKMHNMSARYQKEKQKVGTTGGSPSEWNLFMDMQALLAPYKSYHSKGLVVDSIIDLSSSILSTPVASPVPSQSLPVPSPLPSPSMPADTPSPAASPTAAIRKKGLETFLKKVETDIDKIHENIKHTSKRIIEIEEEKKDILKSYVEREVEVQKALIEFLKRRS